MSEAQNQNYLNWKQNQNYVYKPNTKSNNSFCFVSFYVIVLEETDCVGSNSPHWVHTVFMSANGLVIAKILTDFNMLQSAGQKYINWLRNGMNYCIQLSCKSMWYIFLEWHCDKFILILNVLIVINIWTVSMHRESTMGWLYGGRWSPEEWIHGVYHKFIQSVTIFLFLGMPWWLLCLPWHITMKYTWNAWAIFFTNPSHVRSKSTCTSLQCTNVSFVTSTSKRFTALSSFDLYYIIVTDYSILERYLDVKHN